MSRTLSRMDDAWTVEIPRRRYAPKSQVTDPEVKNRLKNPKEECREDHMLRVLFLTTTSTLWL
jgi:hypothetical protein